MSRPAFGNHEKVPVGGDEDPKNVAKQSEEMLL